MAQKSIRTFDQYKITSVAMFVWCLSSSKSRLSASLFIDQMEKEMSKYINEERNKLSNSLWDLEPVGRPNSSFVFLSGWAQESHAVCQE